MVFQTAHILKPLYFRFRIEDLELGPDAKPEAMMESLDRVDHLLAGKPFRPF
jgi:hypothetical protein